MAAGAPYMPVIQLYAPRKVAKCPLCGSPDIVVDPVNGQLVCRNCGLVIDDTIFAADAREAEGEHRATIKRASQANSVQKAHRWAKLSQVLGVDSAAKLSAELAGVTIDEIYTIIMRNKCLRRLVAKLKHPMNAAAVHIAIMYERNTYPLVSEVSKAYGVPATTVKRLIKRVAACMNMVNAVEELAHNTV